MDIETGLVDLQSFLTPIGLFEVACFCDAWCCVSLGTSSLNETAHEMSDVTLARRPGGGKKAKRVTQPKSRAGAGASTGRTAAAGLLNQPIAPEPGPAEETNKKGGNSKADPELLALDLKRKRLLLNNKWSDRAADLNTEVSFALDQCSCFPECEECLVHMSSTCVDMTKPGEAQFKS